MPKPPPFPIDIDELSAEFLTDALGLTVDSFDAERVGADRGMLGEIFRLRLDVGDDEPIDMIAKFAALREGSLASALRGRNYERELLCYEQLLPETPARTPAHHGSWYDPETAHFLLLQDPAPNDDAVDQIIGLSVDQARAVLDEVAALHARWWADPSLQRHEWLPRLDSELRLSNLMTLARIGWEPLTAMVGQALPELPSDFGPALPERIEAALRAIADLPATLLHCDLRADNLLFDPELGTASLIDWQGCGIGPAGFDLAYFLTQSLTIDDRRAHEDDLIDHWYANLAHHGARPDWAVAAAGFEESLWYGLAVACALPIISDPGEPRVAELATVVATRTLAALADYGQLE